MSKKTTTPRPTHSLRRQIENIKRQRIVAKKVVSLNDFRALKKTDQNHSILVVDDDEIMRGALKRILEAEGYGVVVAEDGLELSKALESTRVDLILLDVNMPNVDGHELCRLIKGHPGLQTVPVVFVSALKSEDDVKRGFEAGCTDYVAKPFDVEHLTGLVERLLDTATKDAS